MLEKFEIIQGSYDNGQSNQAFKQFNRLNDYEKEEFLKLMFENQNIDILYFIALRNI